MAPLCKAVVMCAATVSILCTATTDATAKPPMNFTQVQMADAKGYAVSECYGLGDKKPCGKPVADWWCQQMDYRFATSFKGGCSHYLIGSMSGMKKATLDRKGVAETLCWVECADMEPAADTATIVRETFNKIRHPASGDRHLDMCYGPSVHPCNEPIADWWCQHKGYLFASDYKSGCKVSRIRSMNGKKTNCGGNVCGSMCSISCVKFSVPTVAVTKAPSTVPPTKSFSTIRHPDSPDLAVDQCYAPNSYPCGKAVADWWCKQNGYVAATVFKNGCLEPAVRSMNGIVTRCAHGNCGAMCHITCTMDKGGGSKLFTAVRHPDSPQLPVDCPGRCRKATGDTIAQWWCERKGYDAVDAWTAGCKVNQVRAMDGHVVICKNCNSLCTVTCAKSATAH